MDELLTSGQVAERLRVRQSTVRRWAANGRIPVVRVSPKVLRFDWQDVVAAVKRRQAKGGRP